MIWYFLIVNTSFGDYPHAAAEAYPVEAEDLEPRMAGLFGHKEEHPFHFDGTALLQQPLIQLAVVIFEQSKRFEIAFGVARMSGIPQCLNMAFEVCAGFALLGGIQKGLLKWVQCPVGAVCLESLEQLIGEGTKKGNIRKRTDAFVFLRFLSNLKLLT